MSDGPADDLVGQTLDGRYLLVERLGHGGMGAVYRAEHVLMKKAVAVKVLLRDLHAVDEAVRRFEREAQSASRLDHPNIVQVTDFGRTSDGVLYLVMDLVRGGTLAEIRSRGRLEPARAARLVAQVLRALEHAHERGVVHRDLKPENAMVVEREGGEEVKLLDFGIARLTRGDAPRERLTQAGMIFGTPEYLAPEQALGQEVDGRADLYATGVMLYELLAGELPFVAPSPLALVSLHLTAAPPPLAGRPGTEAMPPAVEGVVMRALAKRPEARFGTAREMRIALEAAAGFAEAPTVAGATPPLLAPQPAERALAGLAPSAAPSATLVGPAPAAQRSAVAPLGDGARFADGPTLLDERSAPSTPLDVRSPPSTIAEAGPRGDRSPPAPSRIEEAARGGEGTTPAERRSSSSARGEAVGDGGGSGLLDDGAYGGDRSTPIGERAVSSLLGDGAHRGDGPERSAPSPLAERERGGERYAAERVAGAGGAEGAAEAEESAEGAERGAGAAEGAEGDRRASPRAAPGGAVTAGFVDGGRAFLPTARRELVARWRALSPDTRRLVPGALIALLVAILLVALRPAPSHRPAPPAVTSIGPPSNPSAGAPRTRPPADGRAIAARRAPRGAASSTSASPREGAPGMTPLAAPATGAASGAASASLSSASTSTSPGATTPPPVTPATALDRLVAELESGRTCRERRRAVLALQELGDPRAVAPLVRARDRRGGFLGFERINACLSRDIRQALRALAR